MKKLWILALIPLFAVMALSRDAAYFHENATGAIAAYIAGSGTNSVIEFTNDTRIPWRLYSAVATTNSVAVPYTVSRVWNYQRSKETSIVTTNLFNAVETNVYYSVLSDLQTNEVYVSTNSLPTTEIFLQGDIIRVDFNSVTGVVFRMIGSTP